MSFPSVSIVITAFKRPKQLERTLESIRSQKYQGDLEIIITEHGNDGNTDRIARDFGAKYTSVPRTDLPAFQNPARIHNIGIRAATKDIVILQGAEVKYTGTNDIANLTAPLVEDRYAVRSACVRAMDHLGGFEEWYSHPTEGRRAGWIVNFCLAVHRNLLLQIQGFEESITGYGYEDDFLMFCLRKAGGRVDYVTTVTAEHQWHDRSSYVFYEGFTGAGSPGHVRLEQLFADVQSGAIPPVANVGKDWGRK
jgi:glycosyltransferase involved in cell wall biosynthesis